MHRFLYGERVESMIEITGDTLSEVLSEAALVARDLENTESEGYTPIFTVTQGWSDSEEQYEVLLFVRR